MVKKTFRKFTKKNVEKKLKLLNLTRSPEELNSIRKKHKERGAYTQNNPWHNGKRVRAKEHEVRIRKFQDGEKKRVIKVNGQFTPYARWFYHNFIEPIPPGYIVYHKDCDPLNDDPDNLAVCRRSASFSFDKYELAISLLDKREKLILKKLPKLDIYKDKEQTRELHSELNRIRRISKKLKYRLIKRYSNYGERHL